MDNLAAVESAPMLVCIEARTVRDELFGQGELAGRNTFITDHYRRFIEPEELKNKVDQRFEILDFQVGRGFAPYGDQDPEVMRIFFSSRVG